MPSDSGQCDCPDGRPDPGPWHALNCGVYRVTDDLDEFIKEHGVGQLDLLTQARTTILNLRAVAFKAARMNRATTENMNDTLRQINEALDLHPDDRNFHANG